eukprot:202626_1
MSTLCQGTVRYLKHFCLSSHEKKIKVVVTILNNVIQNPTNDKYKNLNVNRIRAKLDCQMCMDVLYDAGFHKSNDGKRLLHNTKKLNDLCKIQKLLGSMITTTSEHGCKFTDCLCLQIIINILQLHDEYLTQKQSHSVDNDIYRKIGNNYNNDDLLDDFEHLLMHHSQEFENIFDFLHNKSNASDCLPMRRNHINQVTNETMSTNLYFNDDIVAQQLLDRIHCYCLHLVHVPLKHREPEIQLLSPTNVHTRRLMNKENQCELKNCLSLEIITKLLKLYNQYLQAKIKNVDDKKTNIYDDIYKHIGNDYNNDDLLNDFNHLLLHHSNEFEAIFNILVNDI